MSIGSEPRGRLPRCCSERRWPLGTRLAPGSGCRAAGHLGPAPPPTCSYVHRSTLSPIHVLTHTPSHAHVSVRIDTLTGTGTLTRTHTRTHSLRLMLRALCTFYECLSADSPTRSLSRWHIDPLSCSMLSSPPACCLSLHSRSVSFPCVARASSLTFSASFWVRRCDRGRHIYVPRNALTRTGGSGLARLHRRC